MYHGSILGLFAYRSYLDINHMKDDNPKIVVVIFHMVDSVADNSYPHTVTNAPTDTNLIRVGLFRMCSTEKNLN